jgi:hypothetical protein
MDLARCNARTLITKYIKVLRLATECPLWTDAAFDAQFFGLTIDASASGALGIDGLVEGAGAVKGDTHLTALLPIDIIDTAFALRKLRMIAWLSSGDGKEQGAAKALSAIAVGMLEAIGGTHT